MRPVTYIIGEASQISTIGRVRVKLEVFMRRKQCALLFWRGVFLVASSISRTMACALRHEEDMSLTGTITAFDWGNPHAWSTWTLWMIRGTSALDAGMSSHLPCPGGLGQSDP